MTYGLPQRTGYQPTRYELAVAHPDGRRFLLGYTVRRSRNSLFEFAQRNALALLRLTGDETIRFAKRTAEGATMGAWHINWTGRTQRQAASEGRLLLVQEAVRRLFVQGAVR